jgi:protein involved in polysaccharide export with SLBB domain
LAEEEQVRISLGQMQKELVSRYAAAPSLNSTNAEQEQAQYASQQAAIAQLGEVHPTGRIVLDMKPSANTVADIPDFTLEDGDAFVIPPKLDTIQVSGAVYNATAFRFQNNKRLSAYLNDAGGPTRQADVKRAFLIRADGAVVSRQSHSLLSRGNFSDLALLPGDAIIVPTKMKSPGGFMQQLPYVTQILSQTAMTGALVAAH